MTEPSEKLPAPEPLPYVSRRAQYRAKDALPPPAECRYCGGPVALVTHKSVYGMSFGDWPFLYRCQPCDAHVGLHPHTDRPLGTLANRELRTLRKDKKAIFERLRRMCYKKRGDAYRWLAEQLDIPPAECHWGLFDETRCRIAGMLCARRLQRETQR